MGGLGKKGEKMYHYIEDKDFLKRMRGVCSNIINQLVQSINNDDYMTVEAQLVGSGAKHLETQNAAHPIDLDYNISILEIDGNINDGRRIKEYVRKKFNIVLNANGWGDCKDSTSALTTEKRHFETGNQTPFGMDVAIVVEDNDTAWYRLIHQKTGYTANDKYFWNQAPDSKGLTDRVDRLKKDNYWECVRKNYLKKKNMYLTRNDHNHPSFIVYIETINEEFYKHYGYFK